jgi:hypothetical protein
MQCDNVFVNIMQNRIIILHMPPISTVCCHISGDYMLLSQQNGNQEWVSFLPVLWFPAPTPYSVNGLY